MHDFPFKAPIVGSRKVGNRRRGRQHPLWAATWISVCAAIKWRRLAPYPAEPANRTPFTLTVNWGAMGASNTIHAARRARFVIHCQMAWMRNKETI